MERVFKKKSSDFCEACSLFELDNRTCSLCENDVVLKELEARKFDNQNLQYDDVIGFYTKTIFGYDEHYREQSTAGGLATGLIHSLLSSGNIDAVISPVYDVEARIFRYKKIEKVEDLSIQQRSVYTSVNVQELIDIVNTNEGRFAVTGIPATVQLLQFMKENDEILNARIVYLVGLVSGGYKTKSYISYLNEKSSVPRDFKPNYVSFRDKKHGQPYTSSSYYYVTKNKKNSYSLKAGDVPYNWPYGFLKEFSSEFCYDTFNNCADITVMDAWLGEFEKTKGVTLAIIRNTNLVSVLSQRKELIIKSIEKNMVIESQAGGLRHKTQGYNARIFLYKLFGNNIPSRLLKVSSTPKLLDIIEQFLRLRVSYVSRVSYKRHGDVNKVETAMKKYAFPLKLINRIKRIVK